MEVPCQVHQGPTSHGASTLRRPLAVLPSGVGSHGGHSGYSEDGVVPGFYGSQVIPVHCPATVCDGPVHSRSNQFPSVPH